MCIRDRYFDEREKSKDKYYQDRLKDDDIVELAFAHFNLLGAQELVDFIQNWRPLAVIYRIANKFIKRLIDAGNFDAIEEISQLDFCNQYLGNQYFMIAIAHELLKVGRIPCEESMQQCLTLLTMSRARIPKPGYSYDNTCLLYTSPSPRDRS